MANRSTVSSISLNGHKGIVEMQTQAANVGDLKNVLTNIKVRGTYGGVRLALLLEQFLSPDQFIKNAGVWRQCLGTGEIDR